MTKSEEFTKDLENVDISYTITKKTFKEYIDHLQQIDPIFADMILSMDPTDAFLTFVSAFEIKIPSIVQLKNAFEESYSEVMSE